MTCARCLKLEDIGQPSPRWPLNVRWRVDRTTLFTRELKNPLAFGETNVPCLLHCLASENDARYLQPEVKNWKRQTTGAIAVKNHAGSICKAVIVPRSAKAMISPQAGEFSQHSIGLTPLNFPFDGS